MTTNVDVLYRFDRHPSETAMAALSKVREVYGIRRVKIDEKEKTILVEFDGTRLDRPVIAQLLRGAGINVVEEIPLTPPKPAPELSAPAAAPPTPK